MGVKWTVLRNPKHVLKLSALIKFQPIFNTSPNLLLNWKNGSFCHCSQIVEESQCSEHYNASVQIPECSNVLGAVCFRVRQIAETHWFWFWYMFLIYAVMSFRIQFFEIRRIYFTFRWYFSWLFCIFGFVIKWWISRILCSTLI